MDVNEYQVRLEVMKSLENKVEGFMNKYLIPADTIWQPTDFLPDSNSDNFQEQIISLREQARDFDYDFWVVLIGDMITEEALPTYESWLMNVEGVDQMENNAWATWVRHWTAEENRHGDVLNKYLYLSGRVNMKEVEISTQYLISDGVDIGTARDPYKNFVYTSFQELATHFSHKRVGEIAAKKGNQLINKMCRTIAGDEMRHHLAYREFVKLILESDPNEMVLAFAYMMKHKIVMPASLLHQSNEIKGTAFDIFAYSAQKLGVYTAMDYVHILRILLAHWEIGNLTSLNSAAEKARDYLMSLPDRLQKIAERVVFPQPTARLRWVHNNGLL